MPRRPHLNLSVLVYLALMFGLGLAAMSSQNNLLFWLFGLLVAALFVSGVVSGVMMMGLGVHRLDPGHGTVGEPMAVRYRLVNRNRLFPIFNVHIEELTAAPRPWWRRLRDRVRRGSSRGRPAPSRATFHRFMETAPAWVMHVGPREEVHGESVFWPARRGEAQFSALWVWTTFPFGLVRKSIVFQQPAHTLIYPRLYALGAGVLDALSPAGPLGMKSTQLAGAGDDYFGLREYRPGDHPRRISWRRSANRDEVICIEKTRPSPPKLRVVLNLARPRAGRRAGDRPDRSATHLEEDAISLAASVLHAADAAGYEAGLSVLGLAIPALPVRRSQWHLAKMMAALASIDLDAPRRPAAAGQLPGTERVGLIVVHVDRIDPAVGRPDAWHLTARQLDQLTAGPLGWDPRRNRELLERLQDHRAPARAPIPARAPAEHAEEAAA